MKTSAHSFRTRLLILSRPADFHTFKLISFFFLRTSSSFSSRKENVLSTAGAMMGGELQLGDASKVVHCSAKKAFKSSDFSRGEEVGEPFSTRVGMLRKDLIPHTDFAVFHQRCVSLTASFEESLEHCLAKNLRSANRSSATYKFRTSRYAIDSLCSLSRDFDLWKRRSRCRLQCFLKRPKKWQILTYRH